MSCTNLVSELLDPSHPQFSLCYLSLISQISRKKPKKGGKKSHPTQNQPVPAKPLNHHPPPFDRPPLIDQHCTASILALSLESKNQNSDPNLQIFWFLKPWIPKFNCTCQDHSKLTSYPCCQSISFQPLQQLEEIAMTRTSIDFASCIMP